MYLGSKNVSSSSGRSVDVDVTWSWSLTSSPCEKYRVEGSLFEMEREAAGMYATCGSGTVVTW
jgi:hypothetical protein